MISILFSLFFEKKLSKNKHGGWVGGGVVCKVIFMSNPTFVELLLHWRWVRVLTKIWSVWKKLWWGSNIFKWLGLSVAPNPECGITQPSSRIAFYNILTSSSSSTISQVAIVGLQKKVGKSRKPLYVNLGGVFFLYYTSFFCDLPWLQCWHSCQYFCTICS